MCLIALMGQTCMWFGSILFCARWMTVVINLISLEHSQAVQHDPSLSPAIIIFFTTLDSFGVDRILD